MTKTQQVITLLALRWSFRRIQRETGVHRETVSKYARAADPKPAKVTAGSELSEDGVSVGESGESADAAGSEPAKVTAGSHLPPRSLAAAHHAAIEEKVQLGLSAQRIFQDLQEEYGYEHSYESVKRYVRKLEPARRAVGVMQTLPGEEAQLDFFQGAPVLDAATGQWRRPWVFRMTLCHSRHGYEEAVWDQKLETLLGLHERAFRDLGGVPQVVRHDNLKAAVVRACLYDPDVQPVYAAFGEHWGFTPLPTRPGNPQENGKQERSGGYVKDNALKGRRFDSLSELNEHLRHWNRTIVRLRIHGTTRRQVWTHFQETDQEALRPLPSTPFAIFACGTRSVHPDGNVEVEGGFYPAPTHLVGAQLQVRWDQHVVRIFEGEQLRAVHARVRPGEFAHRPGQPSGLGSSQRAYLAKLLGRCARVGPDLHQWAEAAYSERDARAVGRHPALSGACFEQVVDHCRRETVLGAVVAEARAVEAGQTAGRAEPQEALAVAHDAQDAFVRQALLGPEGPQGQALRVGLRCQQAARQGTGQPRSPAGAWLAAHDAA